jgi:Predicted membrane protein (DUF2142)
LVLVGEHRDPGDMIGGASPAPSTSTTSERRTWWSWFAAVMLVCIAWAVATPLFAPPDEAAHVLRAVAIGRGQFGGKTLFLSIGSISQVQVPQTYQHMNYDSSCFTSHPDVTPQCARVVRVDPSIGPAPTIAARYPPLFYLLPALATRVLSPAHSIYAMRFIAALLCAALFASAFTSAQRLGRMAILGVAAAVTPLALNLSSVVNPSGLEIAAAAALWMSCAALARGPTLDNRLIVRATIAFAVFANTRSLSVPMAIAAVVLPLCLASRDRAREIARARAARPALAIAAVATVAALLWSQLRGRVPSVPVADRFSQFSVGEGLGRTWRIFEESIAWFGLREVRVLSAIVIWLALWTVLLVIAVRRGTQRDRLVLAALVVVSVTFPIVISMLHPAPIFNVWQGRYSLPLWMGVPILSGTIAATSAPSRLRAERPLSAAFAVAFGLGQVVAFAATAHRYAVGIHGPLVYFFDPDWAGPVPPLLLLLLVTMGAAALAWRIGGFGATGEPACSEAPAGHGTMYGHTR